MSRNANANHCSEWGGVENSALGVVSAGLGGVAWVDALAVYASGLRRAVAVALANRFVRPAVAVLLGDEARTAAALGPMVVRPADFILFASSQRVAWILAFAVHARLVVRALRVAAAANDHATDPRVSSESGRALADRIVADSIALRFVAAGVGGAGRHALAVDARVGWRALVVGAASNANTLNFWTAVVALFAGADRLVVLDAALGVRSAARRARIAANVVHASLVRRTLGVGHTSGAGDRRERLAGSAATANVALGTDADHRSDREGWDDLTLGRLLARLEDRAGLDALVVYASETRRAFGVHRALDARRFPAIDERISDESGQASANGDVILRNALGVRRAVVRVDARVDANRVLACLVVRAVAVAAALDHFADLVRASAEAAEATALRQVVVDVAFRIPAAGILHQARVDAVSVDAGLSRVALGVDAAADGAADYVRISFVARLAGAGRAMVFH